MIIRNQFVKYILYTVLFFLETGFCLMISVMDMPVRQTSNFLLRILLCHVEDFCSTFHRFYSKYHTCKIKLRILYRIDFVWSIIILDTLFLFDILLTQVHSAHNVFSFCNKPYVKVFYWLSYWTRRVVGLCYSICQQIHPGVSLLHSRKCNSKYLNSDQSSSLWTLDTWW